MHLFTNKQCVGVFTLYKGIQVLLNEKILLWVFQEYLYIGTIEGRMFILWRYSVFYFCFCCCSIQIFITTKAFNSKFFPVLPIIQIGRFYTTFASSFISLILRLYYTCTCNLMFSIVEKIVFIYKIQHSEYIDWNEIVYFVEMLTQVKELLLNKEFVAA